MFEYKYSELVENRDWDPDNLCPGIDLRMHVAADLEDIGAIRVQEDWLRHVGYVKTPNKGSQGPKMNFITCTVPECLPDRLEITAYALEFGFLHDDIIDGHIQDANLDEIEATLTEGGDSNKFEEKKGASGKAKLAAQLVREMMAIDPARAMVLAKSWAAGVQHSARREEQTNHMTLDEYIPYRSLDVGYMHWHGLVTFGCGITIQDEEQAELRELLTSALIAAALLNDLFSFEKEKNEENVQNAVLVVMREHSCSEAEAREICKKRIRIESANYAQVVRDTSERTDLSDEAKRYIWIMQYTLSGNCAWSAQCPRYNPDSEWNELQLLRAEYGVAKYPARWPPKGSDGIPAYSKPGNTNISPNYVSDGTRANSAKSNGAKSNGTKLNSNQTNGTKRKRAGVSNGDEIRTNGTNGVKKAAHKQPGTDALVLKDVVSLALDWNLPDLSDDVVLQPYRYLDSLPSKGFRDQAIDSLNKWLKVSPKSAKQIKEVVKMLHGASLMLDDLEDNSPLRRGKPSTHQIYGMSQTINSATYQYTQATSMAAELSNPSCFRIFQQEIQQLYIGQSYDIYWTHNAICPSISEYLKMVDQKTGGLFRMLTRLMIAESSVSEKVSDNDLNQFSCIIGRFFQIRDDYQNLASADYAKQKGFAEDLDEGKYSFTLVHAIQTVDSDPALAGDAMALRSFLMKRRVDGCLSNEAKREVLAIMKRSKSLDYTLDVLRELHGELEKEVGSLEKRFGDENFALRMMLEMLRV